MRRLFAAVLALLSVALVGTALANTPEPALPTDPSNPAFFDPQLNVTPSDSLTEGQVVSVDGTGFGSDQIGSLRECTEDRSACSTSSQFTTGRNGNFGPFGNPRTQTDPPSVPVNFTVHSRFTAVDTGTPVNCVPSGCIIDAIVVHPDEIRRACHHITFGFVDATPCTQPTSATTSTSSTPSTTTSSTVAPTSTSTSTPTSTSTSVPGPTTTTTVAGRCASVVAARAAFQAQVDTAMLALSRLTGPSQDNVAAQLQMLRASADANFDRALALCGS